MKGRFKKIVAVLLVGILALMGVAAVATDGLRTLENVKVGGIRIVIDNKEFTCTDANGAVVEPMIYNGTTYIPVRAVSTAFGKAVYWDGEESTVYLGKMDGKLQTPTIKMLDCKNISQNAWRLGTKKNIFDNYGNFYSTAVYCQYSENDWCEYLLDGKYSKFKATLFIPEGSKWTTNEFITIIGDENILYKSEEMTKSSKAVNIEVDVTGVNNFKIIMSEYDRIYIANAGFYQ